MTRPWAALLVVLASGALVGAGGGDAAQARCSGETPADYIADPAKVAVYNFNIHKMADRWDLWIGEIKSSNRPVPELLLIQDLAAGKRGTLLCELRKSFGSTYWARTVQNETKSGVLERAVVWRASRFSLVESRVLKGWGGQQDQCSLGASNAGIVQVRLKDRIATVARQRTIRVAAASFKTPPPSADDCTWNNTKFVSRALRAEGWTGDLMIFGADENTPDRDPHNATQEWVWKCWYRGTNDALEGDGCPTSSGKDRNRRFGDVIYQLCTEPGRALGACLSDNWTRVSRETDVDGVHIRKRIDYLFAKLAAGGAATSSAQETLPLGAAGCDEGSPAGNEHCYSDHRGLRAYIHY